MSRLHLDRIHIQAFGKFFDKNHRSVFSGTECRLRGKTKRENNDKRVCRRCSFSDGRMRAARKKRVQASVCAEVGDASFR